MVNGEQLKRWRLILGKESQDTLGRYSDGGLSLGVDLAAMDEALAAIYDGIDGGERSAGSNPSMPKLSKWLGDVRAYFPGDIVSIIQADAIERKGLKQLLFEPEALKAVKPDIAMVATLMALKGMVPERSKDAARALVKAVVEEIKKKLENDIRRAVAGAINKKEHSPISSLASIDWKYTIRRNLKNYDRTRKILVPERFYFFNRAQRSNNWTVILDMDQSGSMAESVIYGSIMGSIFASIPALSTRVVAFDTNVVDLTEQCQNDPVDMLFGIQLGGGTDIDKSVAYCEQFITDPRKTMFILMTDLYEGGNQASLVRRLGEMKASGVKAVCLLALSDSGAPGYNEPLATKISQMGIPCFACTPGLLPEFLEGALKGHDLSSLAKKVSKRAL